MAHFFIFLFSRGDTYGWKSFDSMEFYSVTSRSCFNVRNRKDFKRNGVLVWTFNNLGISFTVVLKPKGAFHSNLCHSSSLRAEWLEWLRCVMPMCRLDHEALPKLFWTSATVPSHGPAHLAQPGLPLDKNCQKSSLSLPFSLYSLLLLSLHCQD